MLISYTLPVDTFNIQVDNPMTVLTQDQSRQFLASASPKDKYTVRRHSLRPLSARSSSFYVCRMRISSSCAGRSSRNSPRSTSRSATTPRRWRRRSGASRRCSPSSRTRTVGQRTAPRTPRRPSRSRATSRASRTSSRGLLSTRLNACVALFSYGSRDSRQVLTPFGARAENRVRRRHGRQGAPEPRGPRDRHCRLGRTLFSGLFCVLASTLTCFVSVQTKLETANTQISDLREVDKDVAARVDELRPQAQELESKIKGERDRLRKWKVR